MPAPVRASDKNSVSAASLGFTSEFVATLFRYAGLPHRLCLEHFDNLGAYSIPSETGVLIPSVCTNDPGNLFGMLPVTVRDRFLRWLPHFGSITLTQKHHSHARDRDFRNLGCWPSDRLDSGYTGDLDHEIRGCTRHVN